MIPIMLAACPDLVAAAHHLLADHGAGAPAEAERRASASRNVGNLHRFCRWRATARLCALLVSRGAHATVH